MERVWRWVKKLGKSFLSAYAFDLTVLFLSLIVGAVFPSVGWLISAGVLIMIIVVVSSTFFLEFVVELVDYALGGIGAGGTLSLLRILTDTLMSNLLSMLKSGEISTDLLESVLGVEAVQIMNGVVALAVYYTTPKPVQYMFFVLFGDQISYVEGMISGTPLAFILDILGFLNFVVTIIYIVFWMVKLLKPSIIKAVVAHLFVFVRMMMVVGYIILVAFLVGVSLVMEALQNPLIIPDVIYQLTLLGASTAVVVLFTLIIIPVMHTLSMVVEAVFD